MVVGEKPLPLNTNSVPGAPLLGDTVSEHSAAATEPTGTRRSARPRIARTVVKERATRFMPQIIQTKVPGVIPLGS